MGISLSLALLLSKLLLPLLLLYRLLFESLLLLDAPFYRTRDFKNLVRVFGVVGAYITSPVSLCVKGFGVGSLSREQALLAPYSIPDLPSHTDKT